MLVRKAPGNEGEAKAKGQLSASGKGSDFQLVLLWVGGEPWLVGRLWGTVRGQAQESLDGGI